MAGRRIARAKGMGSLPFGISLVSLREKIMVRAQTKSGQALSFACGKPDAHKQPQGLEASRQAPYLARGRAPPAERGRATPCSLGSMFRGSGETSTGDCSCGGPVPEIMADRSVATNPGLHRYGMRILPTKSSFDRRQSLVA